MKNVILSTRNPSKLQQIIAVFSGSPVRIISLSDAGIAGEAVEDGETLEANAEKKARFARERAASGFWTMSDDTGIFINAFKGEPGVHAAYWGGKGSTTAQIMNYCLKRMEGIADRSAVFRTVVALISPGSEQCLFFKGEVSGRILESPRGEPQQKMPYSPIFVPDGQDLCWAEMSVEYENSISHRGKAFRLAREYLESL